MSKYQYYICSSVLPEVGEFTVVTTDYDIYERFKKDVPALDCLALYQDKVLYSEWIRKIEDYAAHLDLLLEPEEQGEHVGKLCGGILWGVMIKFLVHIVGFHAFLKDKGKGYFIISEDVHPILAAIFQDMVKSYGGIAKIKKPTDIESLKIPPIHSIVNRRIARLLNKISFSRKQGGILFNRYYPNKSLKELLLRRHVPIHIVNPTKGFLKDNLFNNSVDFFFTSFPGKRRSYEIINVPFTVGRVNISNTMMMLSKNILTNYLASYQILTDEMKRWIQEIKPTLAVVGERESAISYIIHETCKSLKAPVLHVPHGLVGPWLGLPVIEGLNNADVVLAHSKKRKEMDKNSKHTKLKVIHSSTSHSPAPHLKRHKPAETKAVLILEYNSFEYILGESEMWFYRSASDIIKSHLKKFPERQIYYRLRPYYFTKRSFVKKAIVDRNILHFIRESFLNRQLSNYLIDGSYISQQKRLISYLKDEFPAHSFKLDTSPTFYDAVSKVDYVIGNMSSCFLEAMRFRVPYFCYNPGNLDYPYPLDNSRKYVFTDVGRLMDSIDKISFEEVFDEYHSEMNEDAIFNDYESTMGM